MSSILWQFPRNTLDDLTATIGVRPLRMVMMDMAMHVVNPNRNRVLKMVPHALKEFERELHKEARHVFPIKITE